MTRLSYDPEAVINQLAAELANARVEAAKLRAALAAKPEASEEA